MHLIWSITLIHKYILTSKITAKCSLLFWVARNISSCSKMFTMADGHVLVLNCWMQTLKYRIFDGSTYLVSNFKLFTINIGIASLLSLENILQGQKELHNWKDLKLFIVIFGIFLCFIKEFKEGSRDEQCHVAFPSLKWKDRQTCSLCGSLCFLWTETDVCMRKIFTGSK